MKKVLLIGDSSINMSPYIRTYIEVFENNKVPYDFVYWNKLMDDTSQLPDNFIPYNSAHDIRSVGWKKVLKILGFARFAKRQMRHSKYSSVVVFTIAHAVFLYPYLCRNYKGRYVFDIRDHSPMCNLPLANLILERLIEGSAFTVLSSKGFLQWLPKGNEEKFVISHNTTIQALGANYDYSKPEKKNELTVLTVGQISYLESQCHFVEQLGNTQGFSLQFSGAGPAVAGLKEFVSKHNYKNVIFTGRYDKKEEPEIVKTADFINIWLKSDINTDSCMANRFYLSALLRKPMIVHKGSYMAELCEQYGLGVILEEKDDFRSAILDWYNGFDYDCFSEGCKLFLGSVKEDLSKFEDNLLVLCQ